MEYAQKKAAAREARMPAMRFIQNGYNVDVTPNEKNGRWQAHVRIAPIHNIGTALWDEHTLEGYNSEAEAKEAVLNWATKRIELFNEGRQPSH
jgi:hypothetical protein